MWTGRGHSRNRAERGWRPEPRNSQCVLELACRRDWGRAQVLRDVEKEPQVMGSVETLWVSGTLGFAF